MSTRSLRPLAGIDWLRRGLNIGRHNPRAVFGGGALIMAAMLVPSVVQALLQGLLRPGETGTLLLAATTSLAALVLLTPMVAGYLQVIDAVERERPTHAMAVFAPFRDALRLRRIVGFGFAMIAIYVVVFSGLIGMLGDGLVEWTDKILKLSQEGPIKDPNLVPQPPASLGGFLGLGSLLVMFLSGVYAIGLGQVALGTRGVGGALGDGVAGTAKNFLPLLVLAMLMFAGGFAVMLMAGLVFSVILGIGSLVHPTLGLLLVMPVYLAFLVMLYVVLFAIAYFVWRDVAGDEDAEPAGSTPPPTTHIVA